ncbi:hypothetical protein Btru_046730 [Bulinus truncatus]|nr:hypothetical protein Btru_046730 [Bulinus truncatus]
MLAIARDIYPLLKQADLGPGQYDLKSFVDELDCDHKRTHGRFAKVEQYPDVSSQIDTRPTAVSVSLLVVVDLQLWVLAYWLLLTYSCEW